MSQIQEQLEGLPGYDLVMDKYNEWAGDKFNNTNPFEDKHGNRRVLNSPLNTEKERHVWKHVQKLAWIHDKCFLGSCGVGLDAGIGLVPVAVFFLPALGPILTYVIHARLISLAQNELYLPAKLVAKLQANIFLDFLISLPPVIGAFLAWLNGCLTRNAGILYVYMTTLAEKRANGQAAMYVGPVRGQNRGVQPKHVLETQNQIQNSDELKLVKWPRFGKSQPQSKVVVSSQESGLR